MSKNEIIRIDESGRIAIPQEMLKVLKLEGERIVELHVEKEKLIIKKYSPALGLGAFSQRIADVSGDLSGATCLICDTDKVLGCSSSALKDVVGKKISAELLRLIAAGQPSLINASDGGKLFDLCEDFSFNYRALAALPIVFNGINIGCALLVGTDKNCVFGDEEIKILKFAREMLLSALEAEKNA